MTSGLILTTVGYGQYILTSIAAIAAGLGELIGRGAFLSTLLVLFLLPECLMIGDHLIMKEKALNLHSRHKTHTGPRQLCWNSVRRLRKQHPDGHFVDPGKLPA